MADEVLRPNRTIRNFFFQPDNAWLILNDEVDHPDSSSVSAPVEIDYKLDGSEPQLLSSKLEIGFTAPVLPGPWSSLQLRFVAARSRPPEPEPDKLDPGPAGCPKQVPPSEFLQPNRDIEVSAHYSYPEEDTGARYSPKPLWEHLARSSTAAPVAIQTAIDSYTGPEFQLGFTPPVFESPDGWRKITVRVQALATGSGTVAQEGVIVGTRGQEVRWTNANVEVSAYDIFTNPPAEILRPLSILTLGPWTETNTPISTMPTAWKYNTAQAINTYFLTKTQASNPADLVISFSDVLTQGPFTKLSLRAVLNSDTVFQDVVLTLKIANVAIATSKALGIPRDGSDVLVFLDVEGQWSRDLLSTLTLEVSTASSDTGLNLRALDVLAMSAGAVYRDPETLRPISAGGVVGQYVYTGQVDPKHPVYQDIYQDVDSSDLDITYVELQTGLANTVGGFNIRFGDLEGSGPFDRVVLRLAVKPEAGPVLPGDHVSNLPPIGDISNSNWALTGEATVFEALDTEPGIPGVYTTWVTANNDTNEFVIELDDPPVLSGEFCLVTYRVVARKTVASKVNLSIQGVLTAAIAGVTLVPESRRIDDLIELGDDWEYHEKSYLVPTATVANFTGGFQLKVSSSLAGARIAALDAQVYNLSSFTSGGTTATQGNLEVEVYSSNHSSPYKVFQYPDVTKDVFGSGPYYVVEVPILGYWTKAEILDDLRFRIHPSNVQPLRVKAAELVVYSAGSASEVVSPGPPPPPGVPPAPPTIGAFCERLVVSNTTVPAGWLDVQNVQAQINSGLYQESPETNDADSTFWAGEIGSGVLEFDLLDPVPPPEGNWLTIKTQVTARDLEANGFRGLNITTLLDGTPIGFDYAELTQDYKTFTYNYSGNWTQEQLEGLVIEVEPFSGPFSPPATPPYSPPVVLTSKKVQLALLIDASNNVSDAQFATMLAAYKAVLDAECPTDSSVYLAAYLLKNGAVLGVDWSLITNSGDLTTFTDALVALTKGIASEMDLADAIEQVKVAFDDGPVLDNTWRQVLDISTPQIHPATGGDLETARYHASVAIDQINVILIETEHVDSGELFRFYRDHVIQGQGCFQVLSPDYASFEDYLGNKFQQELNNYPIRVSAVGADVCFGPPRGTFDIKLRLADPAPGALNGTRPSNSVFSGYGVLDSNITGQATFRIIPQETTTTLVSLDGLNYSPEIQVPLLGTPTVRARTPVYYQVAFNNGNFTPGGVYSFYTGLALQGYFVESLKGPETLDYPLQFDIQSSNIENVLTSSLGLRVTLAGDPVFLQEPQGQVPVGLVSTGARIYQYSWEGNWTQNQINNLEVNVRPVVLRLRDDSPVVSVYRTEVEVEPYAPGVSKPPAMMVKAFQDDLVPTGEPDNIGWTPIPSWPNITNSTENTWTDLVSSVNPGVLNSLTLSFSLLSDVDQVNSSLAPVTQYAVRTWNKIELQVRARDMSKGTPRTRLVASTNYGESQSAELSTEWNKTWYPRWQKGLDAAGVLGKDAAAIAANRANAQLHRDDFQIHKFTWTFDPPLSTDQIRALTVSLIGEEIDFPTYQTKIDVEAVRVKAYCLDTVTLPSLLPPPPPGPSTPDGELGLYSSVESIEVYSCGSLGTCGATSNQVVAVISIDNFTLDDAELTFTTSGALEAEITGGSGQTITAGNSVMLEITGQIGTVGQPYPLLREEGVVSLYLDNGSVQAAKIIPWVYLG